VTLYVLAPLSVPHPPPLRRSPDGASSLMRWPSGPPPSSLATCPSRPPLPLTFPSLFQQGAADATHLNFHRAQPPWLTPNQPEDSPPPSDDTICPPLLPKRDRKPRSQSCRYHLFSPCDVSFPPDHFSSNRFMPHIPSPRLKLQDPPPPATVHRQSHRRQNALTDLTPAPLSGARPHL
jgi:hypothetical protein